MPILRNVLVCLGLSLAVSLIGCAPKEEPTAPETTDPAPAKVAEATQPQSAAPAEGVGAIETAPATPAADPHAFVELHDGATHADAASEGGEAIDRSITDASAPFGDDNLVRDLAPKGWKQTGPIEHYNVAALYNKINGRSELYMAYDVLGLSWVSFTQEGNSDNFVDLFVYDMRTPKNGFGIFSVERESGQPVANFGRLSYQTGSNFYFWKGKYYGYVNASRKNDDNSAAGNAVLTGLMARLEDDGSSFDGLDWLPQEGLIQDTVQYFKADALSLDFLTDTFAGQYELGEVKYRAFVSRRKDEAESTSIITSFGKYSKDYAESMEMITIDGVEVTMADWGGVFDAAFRIGPTVAGISAVNGKENATAVLTHLIKQIKAQK